MKKLKLNLGKEMLTKDQMKKISGGYQYCVFYNNSDCGGAQYEVPMSGCSNNCDCQTAADSVCLLSNCCDNADCGCK